jgi:23S rRNA (cytosine1962-C5)-methyltransferase
MSHYAARGGARAVTDLDISAHALEAACRNFVLNNDDVRIRACRHETVQADAFAWFESQGAKKFDLIVLDPPSFAKREAERVKALEAYRSLVRYALDRLRSSGVIVAASCSAHVPAAAFFDAVRHAMTARSRAFSELGTTRHPPDHPTAFSEAEYLKCIYLKLR